MTEVTTGLPHEKASIWTIPKASVFITELSTKTSQAWNQFARSWFPT